MGKVYLIGAGPGEKELLTIKAIKLIEKAEVVIYDRLVGKGVMDCIPDTAIKINVGKNVGNHAVPQEEINSLLVEWGQKKDVVVRLKGGDPFVFGRGGEELEELVANGVEFEVVPGISSSMCAPMYGGIPVTHRDFCSSFHVITGHRGKDKELAVDYKALVNLGGTLIFMMSVSSAPEIATGLIQNGMSGEMPVAFIENATRPDQRKFVGNLLNVEKLIEENSVVSPAIFIVGKVCALSNKFDWFSKKTLKGKKILVTQPKKNSSKLEELLRENGADVALMPMIKSCKVDTPHIDINAFDTIVFTSGVGVSAFFESLFENGLDSRALWDKKFACVGDETAKTLKNYGINADFIPSYFDGETLGKEMIESKFITKGHKLILPRAQNGSDDIINILNENNIQFVDLPVYKTEKIYYNEKHIKDFEIVTFTSKSCVEGFSQNFKDCDFSKLLAVCIGTKTAKLAKNLGFKTLVSDVASVFSMVEKIKEVYLCAKDPEDLEATY